jgi:hypothetical protein
MAACSTEAPDTFRERVEEQVAVMRKSAHMSLGVERT